MNIFSKTFRMLCTLSVLAALSAPVFVSCDSYDDTAIQEAIKDLQNRVSKLEKQVAENVSALQSMISLGSIAKCEYDAENGKAIITLLDGKTITYNQTIKGTSFITVVEKDGKYWWGLCKDGVTSLLEIDGKNVPVSVTPALKISSENEWLISADGGQTWVHTGIFQNTESEDVVLFRDVRQEGDFLFLTLADGKEIKVAIVGEAIFSASETSLWFTRMAEEKLVSLTMKNVKAFTITEKPEGWKAQVTEEMLSITSPADMTEAQTSGTVKLLAVFTNGANPEIVSIDVQYEPEFTLTADTYGTAKVTVSEHVEEGYAGYLIKAWKESEYTDEAVAAWLNSEGYASTPSTQSGEYTVATLADNFEEGESYVIFAVSYIPPRFITSGEMSYEGADILSVVYSPSGAQLKISDIKYDSAYINGKFEEIGSYFAGISSTENWNNYVRDNFLEQLGYGGMTPMSAPAYTGPAAAFPDGESDNIVLLPSTEYTVWMIPVAESGKYTENDFITKTFTTSAIMADASVAAPACNVTEITTGGFTATVTPASGAYKTYAMIIPATSIPETEEEVVVRLINNHKVTEGAAPLTINTNSFSSDDDVYLIAVSIKENGSYGKIHKEQVKIKALEYSDAVGITSAADTYGVGDVTLTLTFKGEPATITYMVASYTFHTDEMIEEMMALSQYGDVIDKNISTITNGNQLTFTGLEIGTQYTFYAIVKDAAGTPSRMFTKTFLPRIEVDYVTSTQERYTYGMPQISGRWSSARNYNLNVEKPANCTKYWISVCDSDYLLGDIWSNTDKLISLTLHNAEMHTESISGKLYEYLNTATRVYMAWLDDQGEYHAIYEYNIQNDK